MSLRALGNKVAIADDPAMAQLECIEKRTKRTFAVRFSCPEFTSLCPVTGQPDFAMFVIDYVPKDRLIESKSLKLFLHAYRNHKGFHEAVTDDIGQRLFSAAYPWWLRVVSYWFPRGGIPIDVYWQQGVCPPEVSLLALPDFGYRGRG